MRGGPDDWMWWESLCDYEAMKTQHTGSDDLDETDFGFDEYEDFEEFEDEFDFGEGGG